jgi:hypothetical protein
VRQYSLTVDRHAGMIMFAAAGTGQLTFASPGDAG